MSIPLPYDLDRTGKAASMLLLAYCGAELLYIWHSTMLFGLYDVVEAESWTAAELDAEAAYVDNVGIGVAAIFMLTLISCFVASGIWIYRAVTNAQAITPVDNRIRPGWAVGWYAVPFANLVMPYRAMQQTWNGLHGIGDLKAPMPGWILAWWLCWIFGNMISTLSTRLNVNAQSIDDFRFATTLGVVSSVIAIAAALLFRKLILVLTRASAAADPHEPALAPISHS